jgi:hypothetical protein
MKPKSPKFGYVANLGMFLFVPWNHGEKAEEGREGEAEGNNVWQGEPGH